MKNVNFFLITLATILLAGYANAGNKRLVCVAYGSENPTAPVEDNGAYLALFANVEDNLELSSIRIEEFPFSNDNETVFSQDLAKPIMGANGMVMYYQLTDGSNLALSSDFAVHNKAGALLKSSPYLNNQEVQMRCELTNK